MVVGLQKDFNGLSTINIELTSRCNKDCWMCGRRKIEKHYPEIKMNFGDMDFNLVKKIEKQLPDNIVIQFHNNGEPLLYPRFGEAVSLFKNQIKCMDTNAKLIVEKADEIIDNLDTLTISITENDPEGDKQYKLVKQFLEIRGDRKPNLIYRMLGSVNKEERWKALPGIIAKRTLHNPLGSFDYEKIPTIPEIGICLDLLNHLVIDRFGYVSPCVRFDPEGEIIIDNINKTQLIDIWNSDYRKKLIDFHIRNKRNELSFCKKCRYWGVPTG